MLLGWWHSQTHPLYQYERSQFEHEMHLALLDNYGLTKYPSSQSRLSKTYSIYAYRKKAHTHNTQNNIKRNANFTQVQTQLQSTVSEMSVYVKHLVLR
jgi:hypothetical protein